MILRKCILALLIMAVALSGATHVIAWRATEFKLTSGDIVVGGESVVQKPSQTLFHSQVHAAADTESMAISFPATATPGSIATIGDKGINIAQTSDATVQNADTGFYKANWCYTYFLNSGGWPVGEIGAMNPLSSSDMMGSDLLWPYMTDADDLPATSTISFKPYIDSAPGSGNVTITPNASIKNNTTISNTTESTPYPSSSGLNTSYPSLKNATKEQITNASTLERVWRNANLANTIPKTYNGTVERPTQIDPKPDDVIRHANRTKVIEHSLDMTKPGAKAHTLFWDL